MTLGSVLTGENKLLGSQDVDTIAPAPTTDFSPIETPSCRQQFTPKKELAPILHFPEITA